MHIHRHRHSHRHRDERVGWVVDVGGCDWAGMGMNGGGRQVDASGWGVLDGWIRVDRWGT